MVKRRREEEIAGVLEFEGRTNEDPELMEWLADHKGRNGGKDPREPGRERRPCDVQQGSRFGVVAREVGEGGQRQEVFHLVTGAVAGARRPA